LQGWYDEALRDFNTAIRFDSEYAAAYWSRGMVYRDLGDIDRAIADFDRALRLDPEYAEVKEARQGASK
jgi:tetratricopeptide (TPR) repeat protein